MPFLDFQLRFSLKSAPKWWLLKALSLAYGVLVSLRLFLYRSGVRKSFSANTKVVSVGNPTLGGTGKTPLINWLLDYCDREKLGAAVLTRGYKSKSSGKLRILNRDATAQSWELYGDEPWLLFKNHPQQTFYIFKNRIVSAKLAENHADLILLDDGMQHLKLDRDLNIVLIDALAGVGNGELVPLGPLREPLSSLKRADIVVYTKTNLKSSAPIRRELEKHLPPGVPQFDSQHYPLGLISSKDSSRLSIADMNSRKCLLFSGIGNPRGFTATVRQAGASVSGHLILPDHQEYNDSVMRRLNRFISGYPDRDLIVCTEKDWVKLEERKDELPEFHYLKMELRMEEGFEEFLRGRLSS